LKGPILILRLHIFLIIIFIKL